MSIKKFISIGLITCMGVGICYNNTYALDDSFLKFLINSSYPEAKVEISNDNKIFTNRSGKCVEKVLKNVLFQKKRRSFL